MNITIHPVAGRFTRRLAFPIGASFLTRFLRTVAVAFCIGYASFTELLGIPTAPLMLNAGSKSDYLENKVLDHVVGATAYTAPGTLYFALFTVAPSDTGGGTEVTGGSYARVAMTNNTTNFPAATGGQKKNGTVITWPAATASWGTCVAVGIYDAASAGNLLFWSTLATNKTVDSGDTVSIPVNSLVITED